MLRIIALVCGVTGAAALAYDVTAQGPFRLRDFGEWWFRLHPDSLQLAQPAIERHVAPFLWDPVLLTALTTPAAPALLAAGLLALLIRRALG
jgi:hypothetical protein